MFKDKKIGLAILNYNSYPKLIESVEKTCLYKTIDHIIIVDNGSTDNSLNEIKKAITNIKKIEIISSKKNGGWSYGYNIACKYLIEQKNVDYIVIATPATFFKEEDLKKLCNALHTHNEYAVLSGVAKKMNGKMFERIGWRRPTYSQCVLNSFMLFRKYLKHKYSNYITDDAIDGIIPVEVVGGAFYIIRSDILSQIGYFDDSFFLYYEENVLSVKLKAIGYKFSGILKDCDYFHIRGYSMRKNVMPFNSYKYAQNSKYLYAKKYLNVSKIKLILLKFAICYGLIEKRILCVIYNKYR